MTLAARQKAARCFALAASTTFPAERATAIERGEAICAANALDLDDFDIPGRTRAKARSPYRDRTGETTSGYGYSPRSGFRAWDINIDAEEMLRDLEEALRRSRLAREKPKPKPSSPYFRDVSAAAEFIRKSPAVVWSVGDGRGGITWSVKTDRGERSGVSEEDLFRLAEAIMTPEEKRMRDFAASAERAHSEVFRRAYYGGFDPTGNKSRRCPKCGGVVLYGDETVCCGDRF